MLMYKSTVACDSDRSSPVWFAGAHPSGQPSAVTPAGRCALHCSSSRDFEQAL